METDKFKVNIELTHKEFWFTVKSLSGGTAQQPYGIVTEEQLIILRKNINAALRKRRKKDSQYKVFSQDDTENWQLSELSDKGKILSAYLYDSTKVTHCCEPSASYECHKLYSTLVDDSLDDEDYDSLADIVDENDNIGDIIYLHCGNVDVMKTVNVKGDFDNIKEAIEEARSNTLI